MRCVERFPGELHHVAGRLAEIRNASLDSALVKRIDTALAKPRWSLTELRRLLAQLEGPGPELERPTVAESAA